MLFSDVWTVNAALFKRLVKIYLNPPKLYRHCGGSVRNKKCQKMYHFDVSAV